MIFVVNNSRDAFYNMAAEEYFLDAFRDDVFLLWQNVNAIVVGKNQNTLSEINSDYVKEHDITVVRRLTGGGAMYQDLGNLNFTFICKSEQWFSDFSYFTTPVISALRKLGVNAELSGRNDITVEGRKISGNAQMVRNGRLLHHGTLLFDANLGVLGHALRPDPLKIQSKGIRSVASRVANISEFLPEKVAVNTLISTIREAVMNEYPTTCDYAIGEDDRLKIEQLADEKYRKWEWTYGYSPKYSFHKKKRFSGGIVEVSVLVREGKIEDVKFEGDFFGISDVLALTQKLVGVRHEREAICNVLEKYPIDHYFLNITLEELIDVMV